MTNYFQRYGFLINQVLELYHPFPPAKADEPQSFNLKMPTFNFDFSDRSFLSFGRTVHHYHYQQPTPIPINETREQREARQAEEERKKKEKTNTIIIIAASVASFVLGYVFGTQYQEYCESSYKLQKLNEDAKVFSPDFAYSFRLLPKDAADCKETLDVISAYRSFYEIKIEKIKILTSLTGFLLVEFIALAVAAFYKSYRLRDGVIIGGFLTSILTTVMYVILRRRVSETSWRERYPNIDAQMTKIKTDIENSNLQRPPPSYEDVVLIQQGYTTREFEGEREWTRHIETGVWFFRERATSPWVHGNRYWNSPAPSAPPF